MAPSGSERRRRSRVDKYIDEVEVRFPDQEHMRGLCRDVSLKGIFVSLPSEVDVNTTCSILLPAGVEGESSGISIQGKVARVTPEGIAIDFTEMEPESFLFLHRLVELHSDNPDQITEELIKPAE